MSSESLRWWRNAARLWRRSARKRFLRKVEARIRRTRKPNYGAVTIDNARRLVAIHEKYIRWTKEEIDAAKARAAEMAWLLDDEPEREGGAR